MRFGENDYSGALEGAAPYYEPTPPMAMGGLGAAAPAMSAAGVVGGLSSPSDDDYTGRMGSDGEPERYSTMRGGDPRVRQQTELAIQRQRLLEPFILDNYLKSANKDIRGITAASQITLTPGTQYRIRDYSGKSNGEIIASGSTPDEFLRMQDIARGLARQGPNADYRLEQVGGDTTQNFGQYRDPDTGESVSVIGGDLYNKPIAGDIIKIALPIALALIPGVGTGLAAGLAAKGTLAAKVIGAGLASGIGRTAAGVLTGDPVLDSLKAGAITGLGSAATAGLMGVTGADKALGGLFGAKTSAIAGTKINALGQVVDRVTGEVLSAAQLAAAAGAGSGAGGALGAGVGSGASGAAGEIVVSGLRNAASGTLGNLASSAIGSGLGSIGSSLPRSSFNQVIDRARLDDRFGPEPVAPDTGFQPGDDVEQIVTGRLNPPASFSPAGALSAAAPAVFDQFVSNNAGIVGDGTAAPETPAAAEPETVVTATRNPVDLMPGGSAVANLLGNANPGGGTSSEAAQSEKKSIGQKLADMSLLDKISLAGVGLGGVTSLLGGGAGGGAGAGFTPGAGAAALGTASSLNPIFSAKLPTAGAGFGGGALGAGGGAGGGRSFAPRDMSGVDFARYGYGPAQSFFENVPRNPQEYRSALSAAPAPQTMIKPPGNELANYIRRMVPGATDAQIEAYMLNPATAVPAFAEGGASFASRAVKGPGTGRSDEIPALLSDGEYVIDAETVAMLGDGSSEAGAKRLDDFRVSIRKHKGRNLAKGKFSANAKRPENYLVGGRA